MDPGVLRGLPFQLSVEDIDRFLTSDAEISRSSLWVPQHVAVAAPDGFGHARGTPQGGHPTGRGAAAIGRHAMPGSEMLSGDCTATPAPVLIEMGPPGQMPAQSYGTVHVGAPGEGALPLKYKRIEKVALIIGVFCSMVFVVSLSEDGQAGSSSSSSSSLAGSQNKVTKLGAGCSSFLCPTSGHCVATAGKCPEGNPFLNAQSAYRDLIDCAASTHLCNQAAGAAVVSFKDKTVATALAAEGSVHGKFKACDGFLCPMSGACKVCFRTCPFVASVDDMTALMVVSCDTLTILTMPVRPPGVAGQLHRGRPLCRARVAVLEGGASSQGTARRCPWKKHPSPSHCKGQRRGAARRDARGREQGPGGPKADGEAAGGAGGEVGGNKPGKGGCGHRGVNLRPLEACQLQGRRACRPALIRRKVAECQSSCDAGQGPPADFGRSQGRCRFCQGGATARCSSGHEGAASACRKPRRPSGCWIEGQSLMPFIDALALAVLCGKWEYRKLNVGTKRRVRLQPFACNLLGADLRKHSMKNPEHICVRWCCIFSSLCVYASAEQRGPPTAQPASITELDTITDTGGPFLSGSLVPRSDSRRTR